MIVLRREIRRRAPGRRTDAGGPVGQERFAAATVVRRGTGTVVLLLLLLVVVVIVLIPLSRLSRHRLPVARPRYDAVGRVGVLSEHAALERFAGLDRLPVPGGGRVVGGGDGGGRPVLVGVHFERGRRVRVVVAPVLVRRLVDVLRRPVTAYRVHAVRNALPRRRRADGAADLVTRPRRRRGRLAVVSGVSAVAATREKRIVFENDRLIRVKRLKKKRPRVASAYGADAVYTSIAGKSMAY